MEKTRRVLRSSVPKPLPKQEDLKPMEDVENLPFIKYDGKLHYYTDNIDCAMACDKLLMQAKKCNDILVIGFDMEWPFSFQTGPGKTALIQLSPTLDECFLFHVSKLKKLPLALTELLSQPNVRLVGVNIRNDVHKLARDFPGVNSKPMLENCIDSRSQANMIVISRQRWSMAKLVNHFFKMQINKDKKVRNSRWNVIPLSEAQMRYAAIDAYASLKLYLHLKDIEEEKLKIIIE